MDAMNYSKFYCIEVATSALCARVVVISFAFLHFMMFFVTLAWFSHWHIGAVIFFFCFFVACATFFCRQQTNFRMFISQRGDVRYYGQLMFDAVVLPTSVEDKWLVYLKLERVDVGSNIDLIIWRDSVSSKEYRRLRRIIRLRQRLTNEESIR